MDALWMLIGLIGAYLMGSVPTGFCVVKALKGVDIRDQGSGNIGASNVGRVLGRRWGIGVLIFDIAKGASAVVLGAAFFYAPEGFLKPDLYKIFLAGCAVAGHNWTIFLGFKGGKGVATSAGALLGMAPLLCALTLGIWGIFAGAFGYISVASIAAAIGFMVLTFVLGASVEMKVFGMIMAALFLFMHRGNIRRLRQGTEPKLKESFGQGPAPHPGPPPQGGEGA